MKINPSAKYTKSLFTLNRQDESYPQQSAVPFKEVSNNTFGDRPLKKRKERKVIFPKKFLDNEDLESEQDQSNIKQNPKRITEEKEETTHRELFEIKQKPKLLLELQFEDDIQLASPVIQNNHYQDEINEKVQIPLEPLARDINKLKIEDMSSSQHDEQASAKVICLNSPKKPIPMKVEAQLVPQIYDQQITLESLFRKVAQQQTLNCILRRDKKNHDGIPEYNVYFQKNLKHIITIRKESMCQYAFYFRLSKGYSFTYNKIAVLNSNFFGSTYTLLKTDQSFSQLTVCYETNFLGLNGPRKIHAYLPKGLVPFEYLDEAFEDNNWTKSVEKCVNKSAKWSEKASSFILSFKGRALKSSIKNFVMTDQKESEDKFYVIFGKAAPDVFNLDIEAPFSLIQGIALAISSFQRKLTCD